MSEDIEKKVEELAREIHGVYCAYYLNRYGQAYWTNGDYDLLDEHTKEADRYMARFILNRKQPSGLLPLDRNKLGESIINATKNIFASIGVNCPYCKKSSGLKGFEIWLDTTALGYLVDEIYRRFGTPQPAIPSHEEIEIIVNNSVISTDRGLLLHDRSINNITKAIRTLLTTTHQ